MSESRSSGRTTPATPLGSVPLWRCPHCHAPQAETARCWVCGRSSTTCSTCRHFRRSLASNVGYCGLDRKRAPLSGRELRGCWQAAPAALEPPTTERFEVMPDVGAAHRGFVPVELGLVSADIEGDITGRVTLFGDPES